jgi:hypothetical protein
LVTSTSSGAQITATTHSAPMKKIMALRIRFASSQAGSSPSPSQVRVNMVVNEIESAPSANRSRRRLGMRNDAR